MSTQTNKPAVFYPFEMDTQPIMPIRSLDQMSEKHWASYFQYKHGGDSASNVRNAHLVVMALVAAATFQSAINPPGWSGQNDQRCKLAYMFFFTTNTVAFILSVGVISILVYGFPFSLEIWATLSALSGAYLTAILSSNSVHTKCGQFSLAAFILPFFPNRTLLHILKEL